MGRGSRGKFYAGRHFKLACVAASSVVSLVQSLTLQVSTLLHAIDLKGALFATKGCPREIYERPLTET